MRYITSFIAGALLSRELIGVGFIIFAALGLIFIGAFIVAFCVTSPWIIPFVILMAVLEFWPKSSSKP